MSVTAVAMIQARMSSTRLPGKTRAMIHGHPMLYWVIDRVKRIEGISDIAVLTSIDPTDDWIEAYSQTQAVRCVRGRLWNVLDRFKCAMETCAVKPDDLIMRISADCPGLDPVVSREVLRLAHRASAPMTLARNTTDWPDGLDTEVFPAALLEEAAARASSVSDREHVTPWMLRQSWVSFCELSSDLNRRHWKWSVDTPEDLEYVRLVFDRLGPQFGWRDVLSLKPGHVCGGCAEGLPHVRRSLTSIGGPRGYTVWDLHETRVAGGAGIEECTAAPLIESLARFTAAERGCADAPVTTDAVPAIPPECGQQS